MPAYLLLYYQPAAGSWMQMPVTGDMFTIGRSRENNLSLDDQNVSRQHACLRLTAQGVWIMDQHSSNGVQVDNRPIPPGQWTQLQLGGYFSIGATLFQVLAAGGAPAPQPNPYSGAQPASQYPPAQYSPNLPAYPPAQGGYGSNQPAYPPAQGSYPPNPAYYPPAPQAPAYPAPRQAAPRRSKAPQILMLLALVACLCLAGGAAGYYFLPGLLSGNPSTAKLPLPGIPGSKTSLPSSPQLAPPQVIDSLPASAGGGPVQDDQGATLEMPAGSMEGGEQAQLERARLSPGMQNEMEKGYTVESLAYAVRLPGGQDGAGLASLSIPAKTANSRLAVLVNDHWLGILDAQPENGAFHVTPSATVGNDTQASAGGQNTQGANRYLVVQPKSGLAPKVLTGLGWNIFPGGRLFGRLTQTDADGSSCVAEFWTANHCWRNPEGTVYAFWENDFPAGMKDTEYLRIIDTVKAVTSIMATYKDKGFSGADLTHSRPVYVIVEAGASSPYWSTKLGNVYVPWDVIGAINDSKNRCTMGHELFHWTEDVSYAMVAAAVSGSRSWWQEISADNASFLLDDQCIDANLTQYGLVNTADNVLGFQASPFAWDSSEQARYIQSLQFYISLCDGGANCAMSQSAWAAAINSGSYPMDGGPQSAYLRNAKDMGRFLLGAAPAESRAGAFIPPSLIKGYHYGDYLSLQTAKGPFEYGLTMEQFTKASDKKMQVKAKIAKGGEYPLWVSNGAGTPMGSPPGNDGLPGLLEIQAGSPFWLKKDGGAPVFYPAGTQLSLGAISTKLGAGAARIAAVAPDGDQTFQATLSLVDLSGDWSGILSPLKVTPVDCPGYEKSDGSDQQQVDTLLQLFSGNGAYAETSVENGVINLTWNGSLQEGVTGESEVEVKPDSIKLHYHLDIPKPDKSGSLSMPWMTVSRKPAPPAHGASWMWTAPLPVLGIVVLLRRRGKKAGMAGFSGLAAFVLLGVLLLSGCVGMNFWGSFDTTYTFHKLEYVGPNSAPATSAAPAAAPTVTWKLGDGKIEFNVDLMSSVTDDKGNETVQPCKLTATGAVTGTIGPDGSVEAPKTSK